MSSLLGTVALRKACQTLQITKPPKTKAELRKHFLELAKKHHPDRLAAAAANSTASNAAASSKAVADAGKRMAEITAAYKMLSNEFDKHKRHQASVRAAAAAAGQADRGENADTAGSSSGPFGSAEPGPLYKMKKEEYGRMWLPWQKSAPVAATQSASASTLSASAPAAAAVMGAKIHPTVGGAAGACVSGSIAAAAQVKAAATAAQRRCLRTLQYIVTGQ
jgi:hypothetical protein